MFYREDERKAFWKRNQVKFAEKAHEFICCNIPTIAMCIQCDGRAYRNCPNKLEIKKTYNNQRIAGSPSSINPGKKEKQMRNTDPFAPWNDPMRKDDPFAPHNDPFRKDDVIEPWNDLFGKRNDLTTEDQRYYDDPHY